MAQRPKSRCEPWATKAMLPSGAAQVSPTGGEDIWVTPLVFLFSGENRY